MKKYKPQTKEELKNLVFTDGIKLNCVDTSLITDMSYLFQKSERKDFEGIEEWDTSNVTNMKGMFSFAKAFNQNINNWNVSKVEDMSYMFKACDSFNQPINDWDVSNVKTMEAMFHSALFFNQPLDKWNTSKVENMYEMFCRCKKFNQPLNSWNVSNVKTMESMFYSADSFNQPLDKWDTKKLKTMFGMFDFAEGYNCFDSLANWDLNKVSEMSNLCFKRYEELPLRIKAYLQAFYASYKDYLTVTKDNVKEMYDLISKDTNKKVLSFKKRLESEFSEELSSVTNNYNFKTIEEAEKYVEDNYNKKDDKKVSFINDYNVLIKDKSREVDNKVLKYIYLEYLLLKRDVKKLVQIDNIINWLDKESFIEFIKNVYDKTNKETAAIIYCIYGGDEALYNVYKKEQDTKLSLLIIKLNIESKYALRLLYKIYTSTKKSEVRYEADKLIDEVMEKMDIDYNEFQLRFSSNLLFNSEGEILLNKDYKLILNSDYSLSLFDIKNNKELKKIPQNFDENLKEEIKSLRKEVADFIKNTSHILSVLLIEGKTYSYDFYKDVFVDNTMMNKFASTLIWNLYDKDYKFLTTFRYSGDGSYSNFNDEEIKIDDNSFVGLASPVEMDDETISKWRKQLEDYELSQPLEQLSLIKLDKDNLQKEIEKIQNAEISYITFKNFGSRYDMDADFLGYKVIKSYYFESDDGDSFLITADVNANTNYSDKVKINVYFENGEEISKRFIYSLLILMIHDFRLTDLF